jgi:hypothetical protein
MRLKLRRRKACARIAAGEPETYPADAYIPAKRLIRSGRYEEAALLKLRMV